MPELKPCAYCGCKMEIMRNDPQVSDTFSIAGGHSGNCPMLEAVFIDYPTKQDAIDACNMRAE